LAKRGRGLGALLGGPPPAPEPGPGGGGGGGGGAGPGATPLRMVPVDRITPNPRQPRRHFDEEGLASLAENLKANGLLQPVLVRQRGASGDYELIAGERRWRAARMAGLAQVPAIEQIADDDRSLELALIENMLRDDLNPIELAHALDQLAVSANLTLEAISQRLGRSRTTISNTVRLLELAQPVQEMIRDGHLSAGHGRALLTVTNAPRQVRLARQARDSGLSVRALEKRIASKGKPSKRPAGTVQLTAPHIKQIEQALSERFGTKVTVREERRRHRGRITIEFYSNEDFERILEVVGLSGAGG